MIDDIDLRQLDPSGMLWHLIPLNLLVLIIFFGIKLGAEWLEQSVKSLCFFPQRYGKTFCTVSRTVIQSPKMRYTVNGINCSINYLSCLIDSLMRLRNNQIVWSLFEVFRMVLTLCWASMVLRCSVVDNDNALRSLVHWSRYDLCCAKLGLN